MFELQFDLAVRKRARFEALYMTSNSLNRTAVGLGPAMTAELLGPWGVTRAPADCVRSAILVIRRKVSAELYCRNAR